MAKKIFIGNYKGGVGKTTSTYNIGCFMKKSGNRVLLIDLDPQSSLSDICMEGNGESLLDLEDNETLNYILDMYYKAKVKGIGKFNMNITKVIKKGRKIDFIPSSLFYKNGGLDRLSMDMVNDESNLFILRQFFDDYNLDEEYDYIIFDCPPSNNIITQSAFMTSDFYIIPTIMDTLSIKGVSHYVQVVENLYSLHYEKCNKDILDLFLGDKPKLLGVFETKKKAMEKTSISRDKIKINYHLFDTVIGDYKEISKNIGQGLESNKKDLYKNLTDEILSRIRELSE